MKFSLKHSLKFSRRENSMKFSTTICGPIPTLFHYFCVMLETDDYKVIFYGLKRLTAGETTCQSCIIAHEARLYRRKCPFCRSSEVPNNDQTIRNSFYFTICHKFPYNIDQLTQNVDLNKEPTVQWNCFLFFFK